MFSLRFTIALATILVSALVSAYPLPASYSPSSVSLQPIAPTLRPVPIPSSAPVPKPTGVLSLQDVEELIEDLDFAPNVRGLTQIKREENGSGPFNVEAPVIPTILKDTGIYGKIVKRETTGTSNTPLTSISDVLRQLDLESELGNNTIGDESPNSSAISQIIDSIKSAFQGDIPSKRK